MLAGQAAGLALVEAGPVVRYQHLLPWARLGEAPWWALGVLAVQAAAVLGALLGSRRPRSQLPFTRARGALVLGAVLLTSATLSRQAPVYAQELVLATAVELLAALTAWFAATALPDAALDAFSRRLDTLLGDGPPEPAPRAGRFELAAGVVAAAVAAAFAFLAYHRHPHIPDEVVYLLHARYFAAGRLWLPLPPVPGAFDVDLMLAQPEAGRWLSPVPPGWPLVLALGVRLGIPWLVNPVLTGLNVVLAGLLLRTLYPARTARLATLLLACSPWHLLMGMTVLTHPASLTFALLAAVAVARGREGARPGWLLVAGLATGAVSCIRPLEGVIVALLAGLWAVWVPGWGARLRAAAAFGAGTFATGVLQLWYNRAITGSPRTFPIMLYVDRIYAPGANDFGFGANRGLGWTGLDPLPGHGPLDVLINANLNLFALNVELLGWAAGSILPLAVAVFGGRWQRGDRLMLAAIAAVVGLHSFYWFGGGPDFGARYWYLVVVPCAALAARGVERLATGTGPERARPHAAAALLTAGALLLFIPWRLADKYHHYRGMRPDVAALLATEPWGPNDLVLVRGKRHPDLASAAAYNPLDLERDGPVLAWARSPAVTDSLLRAYHTRRIWVLDGPSRTGGGYRLRAGPLDPAAARAWGDSLP